MSRRDRRIRPHGRRVAGARDGGCDRAPASWRWALRASLAEESWSDREREYPQYTQPPSWVCDVPEVPVFRPPCQDCAGAMRTGPSDPRGTPRGSLRLPALLLPAPRPVGRRRSCPRAWIGTSRSNDVHAELRHRVVSLSRPRPSSASMVFLGSVARLSSAPQRRQLRELRDMRAVVRTQDLELRCRTGVLELRESDGIGPVR